MKRATAEQSPERKRKRSAVRTGTKGRVPEGRPGFTCSARCVSLAPALVRSVARPLRPTNKGCVCSCQEAACCRATDVGDPAVFAVLQTGKLDVFVFGPPPSRCSYQTPSTRRQHRARGHSAPRPHRAPQAGFSSH